MFLKTLKPVTAIVVLVGVFGWGADQGLADDLHFAEADVQAIKVFLHDNLKATNAGVVIGLVDGGGSRIISVGERGDGQQVDGDTVFGIGSITKTFTVLLLQGMVARGQMELGDPVATFLPQSVRLPSRNGKEITLLDLAAHTSGLPFDADNLMLKDPPGENIFADYTVGKLYAFLSNHTLRRDPGAEYEYSNVGSALLGHVVALKAGADYESLVVDRICRPLHMDSTRCTVTPELKARLATGHSNSGEPLPSWDMGAYAPAGALRSTANDLLKYVSANLGLVQSDLTPLMEKMQVIRHANSPGIFPGETFGNTAMPWMDFGVYQPPEMRLLGHGGGAGGYSAFIGFDQKQRRGVVVLSNQRASRTNTYTIGWRILQRAPLKGRNLLTLMPMREHVGSGIALDLDSQTRELRVTKVFENSPAARAGVKTGIIIRKINDVSVTGKSLPECLELMRGAADTSLRLELLNPARGDIMAIELKRQRFLISG